MSRSLAARIAKLEAQQKIQTAKVVGVIGSAYGRLVVDPDKPGHLKFSEPPGGYEEFARKQQVELQAELVHLLADTPQEPQTKALSNVGIANNSAPLKPGQKPRNFVHLADGTEIKLTRN